MFACFLLCLAWTSGGVGAVGLPYSSAPSYDEKIVSSLVISNNFFEISTSDKTDYVRISFRNTLPEVELTS